VGVQWRVLVPIKHGAPAKTRLRPATREQAQHAELVRAIQLDTLDAVLGLRKHPLLGGLFVVSGHTTAPRATHPPTQATMPPATQAGVAIRTQLPAEVEVLADAGGGLNPALAAAAAELARRFPGDGVVAMVADLPALRTADLLAVLHEAPAAGRSFVRDADGSGTTLLAAGPGIPLAPLFGPDSAQRPLDSGARELEAAASLRCDVDSVTDLHRCLQLGVGRLTSQLVAHLV
jgi:2-phospho-L-lactate/phosphoenolpyruvate guanylyltransferase